MPNNNIKVLANTSIDYQGKNFNRAFNVAKNAQSTGSHRIQLNISELSMQTCSS